MNKFILQFSRVEKAYRLIEEAFILIARSESQKSLQERMKRKCKMQYVNNILEYLGFGDNCFDNDDIKAMFDKPVNSEEPITFQRLLIGMLSYLSMSHNRNLSAKSQTLHKRSWIELL